MEKLFKDVLLNQIINHSGPVIINLLVTQSGDFIVTESTDNIRV